MVQFYRPGDPNGSGEPQTHYLGNRPRMRNVVEKCTFCIQRVRIGNIPEMRRGLPGRSSQIRQSPRSQQRNQQDHKDQKGFPFEGRSEHSAEILLLLRYLTDEGTSWQRSGFLFAAGRRLMTGPPHILRLGVWCCSSRPLSASRPIPVQLQQGLIVTGMTSYVSWGFYIGNFTFLVGVAAAAVLLIIPAYLYDFGPIKEIVIVGEALAVSALCMCLMFVTADLGRPDRVWHLIPGLGILNLPRSLLGWDIVVLNGYLFLNLFIPGYLLWNAYHQQARKHELHPSLHSSFHPLGGQHSHRDRVHLQWPCGATILECFHSGPKISGVRLLFRTGAGHSALPDRQELH